MLTMCPRRREIIAGMTARLARNTPFKLVSNTVSQSFSVHSWTGPKRLVPALLMRKSMGPKCAAVFSTSAEIWDAEATSAGMAKTSVDLDGDLESRRERADSSAWASRAQMAMRAPDSARRSAMAKPMPRLAPVIRAVLPVRELFEFIGETPEGDIWRRFIILSSERRRHGAARWRARMPSALETSLAGVGVFPYNPMDLCIPKFCNERDLRYKGVKRREQA